MKEADLRKWHRRMGATLALLFIVQALTGLFLSFEDLSSPHAHAHSESTSTRAHPPATEQEPKPLERAEAEHHAAPAEEGPSSIEAAAGAIHHRGGLLGTAYRTVVGIGLLGMALSGLAIFSRIRARKRSREG